MKKKYKIFLFFFFLLPFFSSSFELIASEKKRLPSISSADACMNYYNSVSTSNDPRATSMFAYFRYQDLGFELKRGIIDKDDLEKGYIKDENGYLIVGNIYRQGIADKINIGDSIIFIDGVDIKDMGGTEFYEFLNEKEMDDILSVTLRPAEGDDYKVNLKVDFSYITQADYKLRDLFINDINIKKNIFTISIEQGFRYFWQYKNNLEKDKDHILYNLAVGHIIFETVPNEWFGYNCFPSEEDFNYSQLLNPSTYKVENLNSADKSLEEIKYQITPYTTLEGMDNLVNAISVEVTKKNVFEVRNQFNLRSFPFDKQKLTFELHDPVYNNSVRNLNVLKSSYVILENFMKIDDISGWNKESYDVIYTAVNKPSMQKKDHSQGLKIEIEIERKYGYYIFKVIFPIILILVICWSSVWINPKELESRLTITIVCLLSLIAYNFVIDSELPKLEYLTVLDWIILISYIYATIPNILSVYSFRISSTNKPLCEKVESLAREYGVASYVGLVIFIIMLNANLNPDNSGSFISWMAMSN